MKKANVPCFGSELRRLRRSDPRNINLEQLAAAGGISIAYLSDIERGDRLPPTREVLVGMLRFLNAEDQLKRFTELAIEARPTIQISLERKGKEARAALTALARQSEDIPPKTWNAILKLLNQKET